MNISKHFSKYLPARYVASANSSRLMLSAIIVGIISALVISSFRFVLELPFQFGFNIADSESWEQLPVAWQVGSLLTGGTLLIVIFSLLADRHRDVGVNHVLRRLNQHQSRLPLFNMMLQWLAAAIALISGHSVGREGPAIHLGAASGSRWGQFIGSSHSQRRILLACGVASAISASFNTPLAGVIFAIEVILLEYSMRSFIPVILSSVFGAIVCQTLFGNITAFTPPEIALNSLWEIPYILLLSFVGGLVAAGFLSLVKLFRPAGYWPLAIRWGILTIATCCLIIPFPQLLGIGYDTVNGALLGTIAWSTVVCLLIGKLLLTSWAAAVAFPAGIIGPILFIGAMLGSAMGFLSAFWLPDYPISIGFYAMLGMAVMMGAILRAPLAALVTLLELTNDPNIIMPGMLAIVIANLIVTEVFRLPSVFAIQMDQRDDPLNPNSIEKLLYNEGLHSLMHTNLISIATAATNQQSYDRLYSSAWLFIEDQQALIQPLIQPNIQTTNRSDIGDEMTTADTVDSSRQISCATISEHATLYDALDLLDQQQVQWLAIMSRHDRRQCIGVIGRTDIDNFLSLRPEYSM